MFVWNASILNSSIFERKLFTFRCPKCMPFFLNAFHASLWDGIEGIWDVWKIVNSKISSKNNDTNCNFCNFSFLVPYPNKFLGVCICILIFHIIYSPRPKNMFFCRGTIFFSCFVARDWEDFKLLGDLPYWGDLISFLGEGTRPFSSIKPSGTTHVNLRTVDGKIICFICAC